MFDTAGVRGVTAHRHDQFGKVGFLKICSVLLCCKVNSMAMAESLRVISRSHVVALIIDAHEGIEDNFEVPEKVYLFVYYVFVYFYLLIF